MYASTYPAMDVLLMVIIYWNFQIEIRFLQIYQMDGDCWWGKIVYFIRKIWSERRLLQILGINPHEMWLFYILVTSFYTVKNNFINS